MRDLTEFKAFLWRYRFRVAVAAAVVLILVVSTCSAEADGRAMNAGNARSKANFVRAPDAKHTPPVPFLRNCGASESVKETLRSKFGEIPVSIGALTGVDRVMQMFANPKKGSWTLIIHDPTGRACVAASGQNWSRISAGGL